MSSVNVCSASSSTASAKVHSAQAENVHVKSVVQTETQSKVSQENAKKINDLMTRLSKPSSRILIMYLFVYCRFNTSTS